jgi:hypothetical protein
VLLQVLPSPKICLWGQSADFTIRLVVRNELRCRIFQTIIQLFPAFPRLLKVNHQTHQKSILTVFQVPHPMSMLRIGRWINRVRDWFTSQFFIRCAHA